MHHIVLCTSCITLFNCGHLLHILVDHVRARIRIQAERVQWVFGGPQVSSCKDANVVVIKASSDAFN
jgi:hypothetical protein